MPDWSGLLEQLETCVGSDALCTGPDGLPIDEVPVRAVCSPAAVTELCEVVRIASAAQCPIYPLGGRTQLGLGLPGRGEGIGLSTAQLDRVIDYPSRDMTITVEAGIRVAKLQEILRAEGQRLPVDVPRAAEATLGGAIATNTSGPRRYGLGTLRDYVIGITVVGADGKETKAGGRVVKNVAGYDLCKLYIGSLGTLGIITQVTLKLRPLPEASAVVWMKFEQSELVTTALDRLVNSKTRSTAIDLVNPAGAELIANLLGQPVPCGPWLLVVGFEANAEAVQGQVEQVQQELKELVTWSQPFEGEEAQQIWRALVEFQAAEIGLVTFKANFRSSATVEFLDAAQRQPVSWMVHAHAGNGIVFGHALPGANRAAVQSSLAMLRALAVSRSGNLVFRRCPTEWKAELAIWGEPRGDAWLMQSIKQKLDPMNILNPGRII